MSTSNAYSKLSDHGDEKVQLAHYQDKFLQEHSSNSSQFLEDCTYFVELNSLYQIRSTCYNHQGMPFCPIQVKIMPSLREFYGGANFLLQVWNDKGLKIYERALQSEITTWTIFYNYFIYKPDNPDENSDCFHLVNLENENSIYLIEDFTQDLTFKHLAYNHSVFYVANSKEIKLFSLVNDLSAGEVARISVDSSEIATIRPDDHKIHGLFINKFGRGDQKYILVAIETFDNQLDFNSLHLLRPPSANDFDFQLKQFREVVPRPVKFDPILKFVSIVNEDEFHTAMTIRQSGEIDMYYNFTRIHTEEHPTGLEVDLTFDSAYIKKDRNEVRSIDLSLASKISYENSVYDPKYKMTNVFYQKIKNHCKIFNSFCLIKTLMFVAHGHVVSMFDVLHKVWVKHVSFDHEIDFMFRQLDVHSEFEICVLLGNGIIKVINHPHGSGHLHGMDVDNSVQLSVRGKIVEVGRDREDNQWTFILTDINGDPHLNCLYHNKLHDITDQISNLSVEQNFVFLFSPHEISQFIVQQGTHILMFDIDMGEDSPIITQVNSFENAASDQYKLHSGMIFKDDRHLFLVDENSAYKIDMQTKEVAALPDQYIIGLYFSDDNYCYTLSHKNESQNRESGFRLYDIDNIITLNKPTSYLLTPVQVGCQGLIEFSQTNQRMVFLKSYDQLEIVPVLHRNTISFIGMDKRHKYLAARVIHDRFTVLDKHNMLTTWNSLTGKYVTEYDIKKNNGQDYEGYEIYSYKEDIDQVYRKEWYNKILLKKKVPLPEFDENKFFDPEQTKAHLDKQVSFIKKVGKHFYEFKLIEIISETEVKEHLTFVHAFYDNTLQYLYFSENTDLMLEQLLNYRIFMYQKVPARDGTNTVTWKQVHRFFNFPSDLLGHCQFPFIFTPDFTQYLDVCRLTKNFQIRDTFSQKILYHVPESIMKYNEKVKETIVVHRFAWIDNHTFRIINHEGIDRYVDVTNGFKEIEFNVIPLFEEKFPEKWIEENHIMFELTSFNIKDTLNRLIRKYQAYKTIYFLENKRDRLSLYEELFTVDYRVNNCKEKFVIDLSFSFLHWSLMEQLDAEKLTVADIDNDQIHHLIYNILPGGNTIFHRLNNNAEVLEDILKICHPNVEDRSMVKYHIPFLMNLDHKSPMHLSLEHVDFRALNMFLEYLQGYSFDHHSRAIVEILPVMIEHKMPNFTRYLNSRLRQTEEVRKLKKGVIRTNNHPMGITPASFWIGEDDIERLLQPAPIEQDIMLEYIDIPQIHSFRYEVGQKFFEALAETDHMDYFLSKPIMKMIEYKWPLVLKYTIRKLFYPFCLYLLTYVTFSNYIYNYRDQYESYHQANFGFEIALALFSLYFLHNEATQAIEEGFGYFASVWNYLDIVPPVLLLVFIPLEIVGYFNEKAPIPSTIEACIQATISLFLWLKLLYFMRIFQSTGYLVKIIISVVIDMRHFMFVLLLTFVAFADAMNNISTSNTPDEEFIQGGFFGAISYVYRMVLGDFDTTAFGGVAVPYVWILFLACTVFNMIIMLNLLIAIISESFARINSVSLQASYQEKASIIAENDYLIPKSKKLSYCQDNRYLLLAIDIEEDLFAEKDPIDLKLTELLHDIKVHTEQVGENIKIKLAASNVAAHEEFHKAINSMKEILHEIQNK